MLTIYDLDENTIKLKSKCPELVQKLYTVFSELPPINIKHATDIVSSFADSTMLVTRGVFKLFYNDKFIRFYKTGDIINSPALCGSESVKIISEMASELKLLSSNEFIIAVNISAEKSRAWFEYSIIQQQLLFGICATLVNNDKSYDINLKTFYPGDPIIRQGESPDCLYEILDGIASVFVEDTEIGKINPSEIFGEVSFLTEMNRTASVIAKSTCLVQCIDGEHFQSIIKQRPAMVHKMAKTIAYRLVDVNEKLVRIATLT